MAIETRSLHEACADPVARMVEEARRLAVETDRSGLDLLLSAFFAYDGVASAVEYLSTCVRVLTPGFWVERGR